jgi:G:T-mismatch repair DNA endonuclease (very short patch repair protein)
MEKNQKNIDEKKINNHKNSINSNKLKGLILWNENKKGKTFEKLYGEEKAKEMKEAISQRYSGENNPMYGKKHSEEIKKIIGLNSKGKNPWNKGKKNVYSDEMRKSMGVGSSKALKGKSYEQLYGPEKAAEIRAKRRAFIEKQYKSGTKNLGFPKDGSMKEARKKQIFPLKDTKIEVKIQNFVKQLGLEFFTHQYIDIKYGYQSDILIPVQSGITQKTVIEVDGDYWHGNTNIYDYKKMPQHIKEQIPLDFERTTQLEEAGFKVLRLWEHEIKHMTLSEFKDRLDNISNKTSLLMADLGVTLK